MRIAPLVACAALPALASLRWLAPAADLPLQDRPGAARGPGEQRRPQARVPAARGAPEPAHEPMEPEAEETYFAQCDRDGNGWLAFAEMRSSLETEGAEFALYDRDRDGRVTREEFGERFRYVVERTGFFRAPTPPSRSSGVLPRSAAQVLAAYDDTGDGALDLRELELLLAEFDREEIPAAEVLARMDEDGSGKLKGSELELLAKLLSTLSLVSEPAPEAARPRTLEELFGAQEERGIRAGTAPLPPRIAGPVPHFRRLDLDRDGAIEIEDLRRLQAPLPLRARTSAVHAALDADGDGRLTPDEFRRALGG